MTNKTDESFGLYWRVPETGREYGWIIVEPGQTRDSKDGRPLILIPEERIAIKYLSGRDKGRTITAFYGTKPEAGKVELEIRQCDNWYHYFE